MYGRRPDLWNPLLISYFICSNLFWLKSKINTNFFAEVSGCLVASLFYMIFVPLIDSRIRESYEYYLVPFFISTFTLICARVGLLDYSQSVAFGDYLRGLPAGASLRSATPPARRSLRSPNPTTARCARLPPSPTTLGCTTRLLLV